MKNQCCNPLLLTLFGEQYKYHAPDQMIKKRKILLLTNNTFIKIQSLKFSLETFLEID